MSKLSFDAHRREAAVPGEDRVIAFLQECHDECRNIFMDYVPNESGRNLSFLHIKRLQACIEITGATANYLLKDGLMADRLCEIAASICDQYAYSCDKEEEEDFRYCAALCRDTADALLDESHRLKRLRAKYA